jgi:hypothetical protein
LQNKNKNAHQRKKNCETLLKVTKKMETRRCLSHKQSNIWIKLWSQELLHAFVRSYPNKGKDYQSHLALVLGIAANGKNSWAILAIFKEPPVSVITKTWKNRRFSWENLQNWLFSGQFFYFIFIFENHGYIYPKRFFDCFQNWWLIGRVYA